MNQNLVVLAGATGDLGGRIAKSLRNRGATVRALVRVDSRASTEGLSDLGCEIARADFTNPQELAKACEGAACVVSALSGLRSVIVEAQRQLVDAAVAAHVPRFIPSDYSLDFTKTKPGSNRNLDCRREFHDLLASKNIRATSVLNGAFADMLTGQAPFVLFKIKRVLCWGDADQLMDFTTMDNVADFVAAAALDGSTPRYLRIAGDQISARGLAHVMSELTGEKYRVLRPPGGLTIFSLLINLTRALTRSSEELYPPWQGMQYMHNMYEGSGKLTPIDNDRYVGIAWQKARDVLAAHVKKETA